MYVQVEFYSKIAMINKKIYKSEIIMKNFARNALIIIVDMLFY